MNKPVLLKLILVFTMAATPALVAAEAYVSWTASGDGINEPLGGLTGDPERGRQIVVDRFKGNCLACHHMPFDDELFQGNLGPPLNGVGSRLTTAQIRLRIVDQRQINPETVMPGYYRDPAQLNRVAKGLEGKPYFTTQEVEDVVAYISGLK